MGIFEEYSEQLSGEVEAAFGQIPEVDAIQFLTGAAFLGENLTPFQSLAIKYLYSLWSKYPPTSEEQELLYILRTKWKIDIDITSTETIKYLVLCLGRRATKCVPYNAKIINANTGQQYDVGYLCDHPEIHPPIFTLNKRLGKLEKTSNYAVSFNGKRLVYEIITRMGARIKLTGNHPLLTFGGWKSVDEIKLGSRIAVPRLYTIFDSVQDSKLSISEARVLGYLVGGGVTKGNFLFTSSDEDIIKDFKDHVSWLGCRALKSKKNCFRIVGKQFRYNTVLTLARQQGVTNVKVIDKKIPTDIFTASRVIVSNFLAALFVCGGNIHLTSRGRGYFKYISSSMDVIYGVKHLLLRYGIQGIVKKRVIRRYSSKYNVRRFFISYCLTIKQKEQLDLLYQEIGIIGKKNKLLFDLCGSKVVNKIDAALTNTIPIEVWEYVEDLRKVYNLTVQQMRGIGGEYSRSQAPTRAHLRRFAEYFQDEWLLSLVNGDVIWDSVIGKEKLQEVDTYDLSVPDTENFIIDDVVVHNSTLASFISTYSIYSLICKGNPQAYYGIRNKHPIFVTHVAAAGKQAESVFTLTQTNLKKCSFFKPYIDFDKDNTTELRLYTPYDLYINQQLRQRNAFVPRGHQKENLLPGSITAKSITTSAATNRGDATYVYIFSEFAHFKRAKVVTGKAEEQLLAENPQTDYAIAKALLPAIKDFKDDGKVIYESSPAEKGGEFYKQYILSGGSEVEETYKQERSKHYGLIQLATWEARPSISRESLQAEFLSDPRGAEMEYGAHFSNPSGQFIDENVVARIPVPNKPLIRHNPGNWRFIVTIDPGGKAKNKVADVYSLGWGHSEGTYEEERRYYVDGLEGFEAEIKNLGGGIVETIPVNPNDVVSYVLELVKDLGGRNFIHEICYDQWQNQAAISALQGWGYPAIETTFTNPYKAAMYENFLQKAQLGQVFMYGEDHRGWVDRWKMEMKYLQQDISGRVVYYHHPSNGPVQTDDFADVVANLIHRLVLVAAPTRQSMRDARKAGATPLRVQRTVVPLRGPALFGEKYNLQTFNHRTPR